MNEQVGLKEEADSLSNRVVGAAIEVHRHPGPGLLESAHGECLCRERALQGLPFERQVPLPVEYKGAKLECGYRLDVVVADLIIVELRSIASIGPIHVAQLLTYLKLTRRWLGVLINFNVPSRKDGIKRVVNGH